MIEVSKYDVMSTDNMWGLAPVARYPNVQNPDDLKCPRTYYVLCKELLASDLQWTTYFPKGHWLVVCIAYKVILSWCSGGLFLTVRVYSS